MKKNIAIFSLACLFLLESLHGAANDSAKLDRDAAKELRQCERDIETHILEIFYNLNVSSFSRVLIVCREDWHDTLIIGMQDYGGKLKLIGKQKSNSFVNFDDCNYGEPEEYDAIILLGAFNETPNCVQTLSNIARSLKQTGTMIIAQVTSPLPLKSYAQKLLASEKWHDYQNCTIVECNDTSLEELQSICTQAALTIKSLENQMFYYTAPPSMMTLHWYSSGLLDFLPKERRREFCNEFVREFIKENPLNNKRELIDKFEIAFVILTKELIT